MEIKEIDLTDHSSEKSNKEVPYVEQIKRAKKMVNKNNIIEQMEQEWPEMTKEFKKIQQEQYVLFLHKQHDYGPGNISVGTQLQTPEEVKLSLTGLWFRMNDKIQRLKTLLMGDRKPQ